MEVHQIMQTEQSQRDPQRLGLRTQIQALPTDARKVKREAMMQRRRARDLDRRPDRLDLTVFLFP